MSALSRGFRFGSAIASFQTEGGINGPGEPENNFYSWERAGLIGRKDISGIAVDFWNRYEEFLDLAKAAGCDAFRFSLEWARIQPKVGAFDDDALSRYNDIAAACVERGMQPLVTLCHWTHPRWLGEDFWLQSSSPEVFANYARLAVSRLSEHCSHWVTINEPNALVMLSYLFGVFPPGIKSVTRSLEAAANLLSSHIKAYETIHEVQPDAMVTTNSACASVYELDRMLIDLLSLRVFGVDRDDAYRWIGERRQIWYDTLEPPSRGEQLVRAAASRAVSRRHMATGRAGNTVQGIPTSRRYGSQRNISESPLCAMLERSSLLDTLYGSIYDIALDMVGIDYYNPVVSRHIVLPGRRTSGGRWWLPLRSAWDDVIHPEGLYYYARANMTAGLPIWIVENGMSTRVVRGQSFPRRDGWTRPQFIRETLRVLIRSIEEGIPIEAYFHWSLMDNYEWGDYQPRLGLYGIDRERGLKILPTDSAGYDSAGEYRKVIEGLRRDDLSVLE